MFPHRRQTDSSPSRSEGKYVGDVVQGAASAFELSGFPLRSREVGWWVGGGGVTTRKWTELKQVELCRRSDCFSVRASGELHLDRHKQCCWDSFIIHSIPVMITDYSVKLT